MGSVTPALTQLPILLRGASGSRFSATRFSRLSISVYIIPPPHTHKAAHETCLKAAIDSLC